MHKFYITNASSFYFVLTGIDSRVTVVENQSDEMQVNVTNLQSKDEEIQTELMEMEVEFDADIAGL